MAQVGISEEKEQTAHREEGEGANLEVLNQWNRIMSASICEVQKTQLLFEPLCSKKVWPFGCKVRKS